MVSSPVIKGVVPLPRGAAANSLIPLSDGLHVSERGDVGFAKPTWVNGALRAGTEWKARYVSIDPEKHDVATMTRLMGLTDDTPYALRLTRGSLEELAYVARLQAENFAVVGNIEPYAKMPYALPLCIKGVNWNWPAAVWQPDAKNELSHFGVFEQEGWARLDVTRGGPFFAGNIVVADDPRLRISLQDWKANSIALEVNNPTDGDMTVNLQTPSAIRGRYALKETIEVSAGSSMRVRFPKN